MKKCPECKNTLYDYVDQESGFLQSICWKCGHYEDNSPAFRLSPESFRDLVRDNPIHFMRKFASSTESKHDEEYRQGNRTCFVVL